MVPAKIITILAFIAANAICSGAFPQYFPDEMSDSGFQYENSWSQDSPSFFQDDYQPSFSESFDSEPFAFESFHHEPLDFEPFEPIYPQPMNPEPIYPQPMYPQPMYPQPMYPQPIYPQPSYPQPSYPQPSYPQPIPQPNNNQDYQNYYNPYFSGGYPPIPDNARDLGTVTTGEGWKDKPTSAEGYHKSFFGGAVDIEVSPSNGMSTGSKTTSVSRKEWGGRRPQ